VNLEVPSGVAAGSATVFTFNSSGLAAAYVLLISGTTQTNESVYTVTSSGTIVPNPLTLGPSGAQAYLILFGTGVQQAGTSGVRVTIGGLNATVTYAARRAASQDSIR